jgi:hypothetical protein
MGLGGLVAVQAVAGGTAIDDLVLWGVPARGRGFVRELRAFAALEASGHAAQGAPPDPGLPDGALAAAGYAISAATRAALEAIDLRELPRLGDRPPRVLVLDRDGVPADPALPDALEAAGAAVTVATGHGYGVLAGGDMQRVEVPATAFADVSAWLRGDHGTDPARPARGAAPADAPTIEIATPAGRVRETALRIKSPPGRRGDLAAVLAEPADRQAELCLVLLNPGPQRRIGPNRMWVELSRRWAAQGIAALRMDSAGIGDSDGVPAGWEQESLLYEPERLDDVRAGLDALVARGLPPRFVLIGLCSGANWAFHTAIADPRAISAILLNPRALFWQPGMRGGRDEHNARALADRTTWRRVLRGEVPLRRAAAALLSVARYVLRAPLRRGRRRTPDRLGAALERLGAAGTRLLVVFSDREPLRMRMEADGELDRLAAATGVRVELVPSAAEMHTLPQLWLQRRVHELVDDELRALLGAPVGGPASRGSTLRASGGRPTRGRV